MTPGPPLTADGHDPRPLTEAGWGATAGAANVWGDLRLSRNEKPVPDTTAEASAVARLRRLGVIDVGSNSIRLVVFDGVARSPACVFNEKVLCGLGAGLGETGRLSPEGWTRAITALHRFTGLAERMQVSGLIAVATAAVREATDGRAFCDDVERQTGLQLQVASGAEEGRLSAKGVLLGWPRAEGLVCDMGGSSMELARISGGEIGPCATSPLGPLKLADFIDPEKRERYIRKQIRALCKSVGDSERIFLVGGSWRAIARLHMERVGYPLTVLHGYEPPVTQLLETLPWIRAQDPATLAAHSGVSMARLALVPLATLALAEVIRRVGPQRVTISAYGLREGLLYRQMSEEMRNLDPLIDSAAHLEALHARAPGFGEALCAWLSPLFAGSSAADLRLLRAACLLHDINWRVHPDYRAGLCLEIDHPRQYRRDRPSGAGLPRHRAAQPLQRQRRGGCRALSADHRAGARRAGGHPRPGHATRRDALGLGDGGPRQHQPHHRRRPAGAGPQGRRGPICRRGRGAAAGIPRAEDEPGAPAHPELAIGEPGGPNWNKRPA